MRENSFITIRNGATIASLIAGMILLAVPTLRKYLIKISTWVWKGIIWLWQILLFKYALPGWVWVIVFILASIGAIKIALFFKKESEQPEYLLYVEDYILGALWRWEWVSNHISNLWCYCPRCDATLVYNDSSCRNIMADVKKTDFLCEHCHHSVIASITGGNKDYALCAVSREIDRRIRTEEYKRLKR